MESFHFSECLIIVELHSTVLTKFCCAQLKTSLMKYDEAVPLIKALK